MTCETLLQSRGRDSVTIKVPLQSHVSIFDALLVPISPVLLLASACFFSHRFEEICSRSWEEEELGLLQFLCQEGEL